MKLFKAQCLARSGAVAAVAASAVLLSSCTLFLSDYSRPDMPYVASFGDAVSRYGTPPGGRFWEKFSDPLLNAVTEEAVKHNYDLRAAAANVEKAKTQSSIARTDRNPTASASFGPDAKRALDRHDSLNKSSSLSFEIGYEADVFGKVEASVRSADESYRATAWDYYAMRLTVISSTAQAYWDYACAKQLLEISRADLRDSERRLALIQAQYGAGAADAVDLDTARIDNLKIRESVTSAEHDVQTARTALDALTGRTADQDIPTARLEDAAIPEVGGVIPAQLLARRPDLMEYEALLRQALADYDTAKLAFFPGVSFTAGLTSGSTVSLGDFLANPIGALGAAITLPFLNFHKLSLEKESALKDEEIAQLNFVSAYIAAVRDVYDAQSGVDYNRKSLDNAQQQLVLARQNYERYFERYRSGLSPLSDLLDASDNLRSAESSVLTFRRDLLSSQMQLMAALGGDTQEVAKVE
jgi:NodT family efflux transporter outer membrane factor (OMF) lipoprotein